MLHAIMYIRVHHLMRPDYASDFVNVLLCNVMSNEWFLI